MGKMEDESDLLTDFRLLRVRGKRKSSEYHNEFEMGETGEEDSDYLTLFRDEQSSNESDTESDYDTDYGSFLEKIKEGGDVFSSGEPSTSGSEEERDPQYELFLKQVMVDGDFFSCEKVSNSGVTVHRYEESSSEEENEIPSKRDSKSVKDEVLEKKTNRVKKFSKVGKGRKYGVRVVPSKGRKREANVGKTREEDEGIKKAVNEAEIKEEEEDEYEFVSCKSSREPLKKVNCVTRDESYDEILASLAKDGENMAFGYESDHRSRHQNDDESSSDLEILASENIPFHGGGYTPFVPSKCYESLLGEESREVIEKNFSQALFREKLTNLLKQPYDEKEFQNLWKEVTVRKPVEKIVELRGVTKVYQTREDGKSYLDHYNDLKVKIEELRPDREKILYLLRGFFFWLENIADAGAFKPWCNSFYLKALQ